MPGRVIHTGQAIVDLVMRVAALPPPGGDVFASDWAALPGGGYNTMAAAARDGARVLYSGGHGTGPFGDRVREAMAAEGIELLAPVTPGRDTGFCVALVDDTAERTFVSTLGAEGEASPDVLRSIRLEAQDVVYVSGYSLHHAGTRAPLLAWVPGLPEDVHVVLDTSPLVGALSDDALVAALGAVTVCTANEPEARTLLARLGASVPDGVAAGDLVGRLRTVLGRDVLVRTGVDGCWVATAAAEPLHVPAAKVAAVDTNGAGDAHTGVVCACLARAEPLPQAVRRANVAAALATTRSGPATAPVREETDRALREQAL